MSRWYFLSVLLVGFVILTFPGAMSQAQEAAGAFANPTSSAGVSAANSAASAAAGQTRIDVDQDSGAVRIIVDGKEVARFDADGLFVDGQVATTKRVKTNVPPPATDKSEEVTP